MGVILQASAAVTVYLQAIGEAEGVVLLLRLLVVF